MSDPSDGGDGDSALPQGDRLQILSPEELDLLWGRPRFSRSEREIFFALTARERVLLERLRTARTRAHFVLQLGYFRARQRFFALDRDAVAEDLAYVREAHLDGAPVPDLEVSDHTRQNHIALILELHGFRLLDRPTRAELERRALRAARISNRPLHVLRDLVDHLRRERVVLPGYSYLQDLVRRALAFERNRLAEALQNALSAEDERRLDELLADEDGLHAVTRLKHHPRDHSLRQINREIRRGESLRPLLAVAERIVAKAELSPESVRFYASLVDYYTVYKLKRMEPPTTRLYLLCFVTDRYRQLNDHLIDALRSLVRRYLDEAGRKAKEALFEHRRQAEADLEQGVSLLRLYVDPAIDDDTAFGEVRARARTLLPNERLARLCDHLANDGALDELAFEWQAIDTLMPRAKRNLRPLLRFLRFEGSASQRSRLEAVEAMAEAFRSGKAWPEAALFPELVADRHRRHLFDASGAVRRDRYEFLIYRTLRDALESGDIFCSESVRFRSFEDDLVDEATFARRDVLLPELGVVAASTPIECRLGELRRTLDERFEQVNGRIRRGENPLAQLRHGRLVWGRVRDEEDPLENEPLFDAVERIDVAQLLLHVDRRTRFLDAFEHVTGRGQHRRARGKPITVAALLAFATNIGLGRMAEISNLSRGQLATAAANLVRLETVREANDRLANATAKLPIFRHFDIGRAVHSSSDGQRFESAIPTINARHSAKYFGLKKGVVAYTLLASHVPLSARIIGANEHESHHVFDVLFNNLTDIRPEAHSTDTHGTNQVNFALLNLFGYAFAPRYRDFREKVRTALYGFHHPREVEGPLKPVRRIREPLIVSEWPNIERILLSLALKTTTQSVLVSKLSSWRRQNRTARALWELEHVFRSLYLLDYVDSAALRGNVQRALNRGESYHRLRRAVAYAHGGRFRVRSQHEQELWNECARLVASAVVHYNGLLLSEVLKTLQRQRHTVAIEALGEVSPLSWQHINFYGRYRFEPEGPPLNLAAMASGMDIEAAILERRSA